MATTIKIIKEEWLQYPAAYRCLFNIGDDPQVKYYAKQLSSLEELENRDSSIFLSELESLYKE